MLQIEFGTYSAFYIPLDALHYAQNRENVHKPMEGTIMTYSSCDPPKKDLGWKTVSTIVAVIVLLALIAAYMVYQVFSTTTLIPPIPAPATQEQETDNKSKYPG